MAFVKAKDLKPTVKVLIVGPTQAGKTFPGLQLPGRKAAFDGEDGLRPYRHKFDFDVDTFDTIEDLNQKMHAVVDDKGVLDSYDSYIIDGLTVAWHAALRDVENDNGEIRFEKQRDLKSGFKEFNDLVFKLGKRDKNVWATAQSKNEWEVQRGQAPKVKGQKGDVDDRIWYAFDLVFFIKREADDSRTITVLKSRYPEVFPLGEVFEKADIIGLMQPIFSGTARYVEQGDDRSEAVVAQLRDAIKSTLRQLKSVSNGGVVPDADGRRIWAIAEKSRTVEELQAAVAELAAYGQPAPAA